VSNQWILNIHDAEDEVLRLVCLHHAGGAASFFRGWRGALPPRIGLSALQLPGREERQQERLETSMDRVLDEVERELVPRAERPYVLFGHSLGARIALELARRLSSRAGRAPRLLGLSATASPTGTRGIRIHELPDADFLRGIRAYAGTPKDVLEDPELMQWFLPRLRADTTLLERHEFSVSPPLDVPIACFFGIDDPVCNAEEANRWRLQTNAACTVQGFDGGHFYLRDHYRTVVKTLVRLALGEPAHASAPLAQDEPKGLGGSHRLEMRRSS
jgi:surfactin synthase thioesterase subunit